MPPLLVGLSAASILLVGLRGPVAHLIRPADAAIPRTEAPQAAADAPRPAPPARHAVVKKPRPTAALPSAGKFSPPGALAEEAQPLTPEAFGRRFPRHVSLSHGFASRFVAAKLLERPATIDPRSAFAAAKADALADAAVLHPVRPTALASAALASADLPQGGSPPMLAPPARSAPAVLASLGNGEFDVPPLLGLPERVDAPDLRPRLPEAALAPGKPETPQAVRKPEKPAKLLAYARPDDPVEEPMRRSRIPWPGGKKRTAIYDISAGVVHMPNGDRLEAHSGRGRMRDNPKYVHVKMHGPTPPSTYRLTMREARFHGVEAIRLTPVDGKAPHGRVGLLAHTYLLRNAPPGDSSGCVAFRDYQRFLKAFKRGEVDQMVVVASMDRMPIASAAVSRVASLFSRGR